jgi:probable rRNA maturation factor
VIVDVSGPAVPRLSRAEIAAFAQRVLRAAGAKGIAEVSIAFVDDAAMRALNRKYRRKNTTTDVLTFPGERPDIVISLEQARRQAADEKHSLATEVRYLVLHGLLHALGYDHETDRGEMNALEMKVRARVGLA